MKIGLLPAAPSVIDIFSIKMFFLRNSRRRLGSSILINKAYTNVDGEVYSFDKILATFAALKSRKLTKIYDNWTIRWNHEIPHETTQHRNYRFASSKKNN